MKTGDRKLIVRSQLVGLDIREIEAHLELVPADQSDSLFLGNPVEGDLDFVVIPSFADLELLGAVDAQAPVALGRVVGQDHRGALGNVERQRRLDRVIAGRRVENQGFGTARLGNDGLGLADFLTVDFVDSLDFKSIRFARIEILADELTRGSGRLGRISVDENFRIHRYVYCKLHFGARDRRLGRPSSAGRERLAADVTVVRRVHRNGVATFGCPVFIGRNVVARAAVAATGRTTA